MRDTDYIPAVLSVPADYFSGIAIRLLTPAVSQFLVSFWSSSFGLPRWGAPGMLPYTKYEWRHGCGAATIGRALRKGSRALRFVCGSGVR